MNTQPHVSVVVCTFNPAAQRIEATMRALQAQSLTAGEFEVLVVDNASDPAVLDVWGLSNLRIIKEPRQGLTHARLRGVREARAPVIAFVDDDNLLSPNYLEAAKDRFAEAPDLGAIGGPIYPEWEGDAPPTWLGEFFGLLALRDLGDQRLTSGLGSPPAYPDCAPVGAGMVVRRDALAPWIKAVADGVFATDRAGGSLTSGGDNDIILHLLKAGWNVGYEPGLRMRHIIPEGRLEPKYLGRLSEAIMISWIETLDRHGIRPWAPSTPIWNQLRLARLFGICRPWESSAHYIRWKARRGVIIGRSRLTLTKI